MLEMANINRGFKDPSSCGHHVLRRCGLHNTCVCLLSYNVVLLGLWGHAVDTATLTQLALVNSTHALNHTSPIPRLPLHSNTKYGGGEHGTFSHVMPQHGYVAVVVNGDVTTEECLFCTGESSIERWLHIHDSNDRGEGYLVIQAARNNGAVWYKLHVHNCTYSFLASCSILSSDKNLCLRTAFTKQTGLDFDLTSQEL